MAIHFLMKSIRQLNANFTCLLLAIALSTTVIASQGSEDKLIRLNPEFKITRSSNGSVTVTSTKPDEKQIKHVFSDFYADLLMGAYRKQSIDNLSESLRKKYYLSEDDFRREFKHALNTLAEWKIVIRDDDLAHQR